MARRLPTAAAQLLIATTAFCAPATCWAAIPAGTFIRDVLPEIDPYTVNYFGTGGDRFALASGTAITFDPYLASPYWIATSTLSYDGTVGGLFWIFGANGGFSGDFRQANGTFTRSADYEPQDGMPVQYPLDIDGIAFKTGIIEDQLDVVDIVIRIGLGGPGGMGGQWNLDDSNLMRDASGQSYMFAPRDEFVSFSGEDLDEFLPAVSRVSLLLTISPAQGVDEINIPSLDVFDPDPLAFVRLVPIPIPPVLWLFASALGLLGWLKRREV